MPPANDSSNCAVFDLNSIFVSKLVLVDDTACKLENDTGKLYCPYNTADNTTTVNFINNQLFQTIRNNGIARADAENALVDAKHALVDAKHALVDAKHALVDAKHALAYTLNMH